MIKYDINIDLAGQLTMIKYGIKYAWSEACEILRV